MRWRSLSSAVIVTAMLLAQPLAAQEKPDAKKAGKPCETDEKAMKKMAETATTGIEVTKIEPFVYCAVEMTGSYEKHAEAFMKLYTEAGKQGLPMNDAPFGIYWNSPHDTAEEELKWEVGIPVPADAWDHTIVVQWDFEGAIDSDEIEAVYYGMYEWIGANGYEMAGPIMERFLSAPAPNEKGEMIGKVQIVYPVKKKEM
jgi:DNA gyrase inhibitor GyrI